MVMGILIGSYHPKLVRYTFGVVVSLIYTYNNDHVRNIVGCELTMIIKAFEMVLLSV
jgi:hypothetical protein